MFHYKTADLFGQLLLLALAVASYFVGHDVAWPFRFAILFTLFQAISILAHLMMGKQGWKIPARRFHHIALLLVLAVFIYAVLKPGEDRYDMRGLDMASWLLIPASILVFSYTVITYIEWVKLKKILHPHLPA